MRKSRLQTFVFVTFSVFAFVLCACSSDSDGTPTAGESSSSASMVYVGNSPVVITEIDPINTSYKDHLGEDPAWIELYNQQDSAINMNGLALTKSRKSPREWVFGNVVIPAKSYLIVFLSGNDLTDLVSPSDSISLIGTGTWAWSDSENTPVAGTSTVGPYAFTDYREVLETGPAVSAQMQLGPVGDLGWASVSFFMGLGTSNSSDTHDISATNEILLTGYLTKNTNLQVQLAQPDIDDWLGWGATIIGTGDSTTTYSITLPTGQSTPDLANIYGMRFAPPTNENSLIQFTFKSIIARNCGHLPHASFKPEKEGGTIFLTNGEGNILDSVKYPELPLGKSWTLGAQGWGYSDPSPAGINSATIIQEHLDKVENLPPSGFYSDSFSLALPVAEGTVIRYELGGKIPTATSPAYATPIPISSTTVIRCAAFKQGALTSDVTSRTYIFETAPTIPSVFITSDPGALFDPDTGIYMEGPNAQAADPHYGANYWKDITLPVTVSLMEVGVSSPAFEEAVGFEIFGNYSRAQSKKSVAIKFSENFGKSSLKYALIPEYPNLTKYKDFILRSNANNNGQDYIRDRLASSITKGLGVDFQKGRPVIVFYNGEYYGIHEIRERSNEDYFETNYGIEASSIDLLKADNSASNGSSGEYIAMIDWIEANGVLTDSNYAYVASLMDVDNYINYMQTEMYVENRDWPANNVKKWRSASESPQWKWFLYDLDFGFNNGQSIYSDIDMFTFATATTSVEEGSEWPNGPQYTFLFRSLLKNETFKATFINRFTALLSTKFSATRVQAKIDAMMTEIQAEIARDQDKWSYNPNNMDSHLNLIKSFAANRPAEAISEMQSFFGLGATVPITLSVQGSGNILVHNLSLDTSSVTIYFFEGYSVLLSAVAKSGGSFTKWSDGETSPTRWIVPSTAETLTAIFK